MNSSINEQYNRIKDEPKVVECDECKQQWLLQATEIAEDWVEVKGKKILVTYFLCPRCGKVYVICIDDVLSLRVKDLMNHNLKKIEDTRAKGGIVTESQLNRVSRNRKDLVKAREVLKQQYNGLFYQKSNPPKGK